MTADGKTTTVNEPKRRLEKVQTLHFDGYTFDGEGDDFYQWVLDGTMCMKAIVESIINSVL